MCSSATGSEHVQLMTEAYKEVQALCKHFEGLYLSPYLCSAGVPTIGYGATYYEDGTRVTLKDKAITRERAEQLLRWHIMNVYMPKVMQLCPGIRSAGDLAALTDFAFNLGVGNLKSSTLRKRVNSGEWDDVPAQFMRWTRAAGEVLRGLVRRREAEVGTLREQ